MFSSRLWNMPGPLQTVVQHGVGRMLLLAVLRISTVGMFIICVGLPTQATSQNDLMLIATPDSCVALHRGQQCFLSVQLSWTEPVDSEVCLFAGDDERPLLCVSGNTQGVSVEYASSSSTRYSLKVKDTTHVLAAAMVRTAWVYRSGRRSSSGWRLF
ncbi:MAG: DUF3019 domain-containing protein [Granulosicoccus sp.]